MTLLLMHPEVAGRDCGHCSNFLYNREGQPIKLHGTIEVRRPASSPPPCGTCPKVPKGHPNPSPFAAVELDDQCLKALAHFEECDAVGVFPDDPIVRQTARIIRRVVKQCDQVKDDLRFGRLSMALMAAAALKR